MMIEEGDGMQGENRDWNSKEGQKCREKAPQGGCRSAKHTYRETFAAIPRSSWGTVVDETGRIHRKRRNCWSAEEGWEAAA